jgi:hypothetical protein
MLLMMIVTEEVLQDLDIQVEVVIRLLLFQKDMTMPIYSKVKILLQVMLNNLELNILMAM